MLNPRNSPICTFLRSSFFFLASLGGLSGQAQSFSPIYQQIGLEEGLPSLETYHSLRDHRDNLWICTDNGVSRYDGNSIVNYGQANGMCSNVVFGGVDYPERGQVWFYTYTGELTYYSYLDDKFHCFELTEEIQKIFQSKVLLGLELAADTFLISFRWGFARIRVENDSLTYAKLFTAKSNSALIMPFPNGQVGIGIQKSTRVTELEFAYTYGGQIVKSTLPSSAFSIKHFVKQKFGENYFIALNDYCYEVDGQSGAVSFLGTVPFITSLASCKKGEKGIYLGSVNNGLFYLADYRDVDQCEQLLSQNGISSIQVDREGILWVSSLSDGQFYLQERHFSTLTSATGSIGEQRITNSTQKDSILYIGTRRGDLFRLVLGSNGTLEYDYLQNVESEVVLLAFMGDKLVVKSKNNVTRELESGRSLSVEEVMQVRIQNEGPRILLKDKELYLRKSVNNIAYDSTLMHNWDGLRPTVSHYINDSTIYFGGPSGLNYWDGKEVVEINYRPANLTIDARDFLTEKGDTVIVATRGLGILRVSKGRVLDRFGSNVGISDQINKVFRDSEGILWVGTNADVISLGKRNEYKPEYIGLSYGWPSSASVSDFHELGNKLLITSTKGLFLLDKSISNKSSIPRQIQLDDFAVNGSSVGGVEHIDLNENENNIAFKFHVSQFTNAGKNIYRYRLKQSENTPWTIGLQTKVEYNSLEPGAYSFEIAYQDEAGNWSGQGVLATFIISPPLWQRWWFLLLILLLSTVIVSIVLGYRNRKRLELDALQNRLILIQQKSLGSQLNPHFIFNSLNSISYYLSQNDVRNSVRFMGKFSKLMRLVFENSAKNLISLTEEIDLAKKYVEMEQLRVGEKLQFKYEIDKKLNLDEYQIPPITLQPLIENAIWHGLLPKESGGTIILRILEGQEEILLEIEDDGVGRTEKTNGRVKLSSTKVLMERMELIRRIYQRDFRLEYLDKENEGEKNGTIVRIYIPKLD